MAIHNPVTTMGVNSSGDSEAIIITDGATKVVEQSVRVGDDVTNDALKIVDAYTYTEVDSDTAVKNTAGYVAGYIVTAGAATTLTLYDNIAASGAIIHKAAAVDASGTSVIVTFPKAFQFKSGLYADIGGASATVNIIWK